MTGRTSALEWWNPHAQFEGRCSEEYFILILSSSKYNSYQTRYYHMTYNQNHCGNWKFLLTVTYLICSNSKWIPKEWILQVPCMTLWIGEQSVCVHRRRTRKRPTYWSQLLQGRNGTSKVVMSNAEMDWCLVCLIIGNRSVYRIQQNTWLPFFLPEDGGEFNLKV